MRTSREADAYSKTRENVKHAEKGHEGHPVTELFSPVFAEHAVLNAFAGTSLCLLGWEGWPS